MDILWGDKMRKAIAFCSVIVLLSVLSSCDPYYDSYPYEQDHDWYCEQIDLKLSPPTSGSESPTLHWNGETLAVYVSFHVSRFYIEIDNGDEMITSDEELASGTWDYEGNNLVFTITKDNIFDGAIHKLVFVPVSRNDLYEPG